MQSESTEITIAIIAASVLFLVFAGFIISFLFFYNQKKRTHHQELKDQQKRIENEAFRSEMEIRENTLRHVAEEIHDNVGQIMLLAKLNLNKYLIANPGSDVEETRNIVGEAIQELRGLTKMLNANQIISMNLVSVIERELIRLKKTGLVETTFNVEGEDSEIDSSKKLILFRMIQEILQNIMKHSKSTKVGINLIYDEKYLYLNIEDNGIGFDPDELLNKKNSDKGSGLSNLQNRA
ncbi:MAG: ATP-binding protein, partial [Ferruginibacter sp.]